MELAAIITISISIIVVILQIITITMVVGTRKMVRDQVGKANPAPTFEKTGERRDRDFRSQNKRPAQDQRPKPSFTPNTAATPNAGSVDTVEKSLRDINLKLKNAERDQEFARRKVHDNFPKDPNRRPNNDRNNRGGRDNGRDGRDGRDNRDRNNYDRTNRNQRGGNWQERNKTREELSFQPVQQTEAAQKIENQTSFITEGQVQVQESQSVAQFQPQTSIPSPAAEVIVSDSNSDENLAHGRKVLVKRRVLKEGDEQQSENSTESNSSEASSSNTSNDDSEIASTSDALKAPESEIRFGRR
jgi:hypothetical protein